MHRTPLLLIVISSFLAGCSSSSPDALGQHSQSIISGSADTEYSGVVAAGHAGMFCSGFLITPDLVVTGHHCVVAPQSLPSTACTAAAVMPPPLPAAQLFAVTGADISKSPGFIYASDVHVVPDFATKTLCGNDLAVIQLADPVANAATLELRLDPPPALDEVLTVVGYGFTDPTNTNSQGIRTRFDGARVDHVGAEELAGLPYMVEGEFSVDTGPCAGDSGAPAIDSEGKVVGVMSRGNQSTCNHMVYERLDPHAEWLKKLARASAERLSIAPPSWAAATIAPDAGSSAPDGGDAGTPSPPAKGTTSDDGCAMGPLNTSSRSSWHMLGCWTLLGIVALRRKGRLGRAVRTMCLPCATKGRRPSPS